MMSWYQNNPKFYISEQKLIAGHPRYNTLHYRFNKNYITLLGLIHIVAEIEGEIGSRIKDKYKIMIIFPDDYPNSIPIVKELGNRIRHIPYNHVNPQNAYITGSLCMGTATEMHLIFNKEKNILNFLNEILIPFLYYTSYKEKHGIEPYQSRPHGEKGILDFYKEYFKMRNINNIIKLLNYIVEHKKKNPKFCPCNSGIVTKKCHKNMIDVLSEVPSQVIREDIKNLKTL